MIANIHIKHLLWLASVGVACVLVAWALHVESKHYTDDKCLAIQREVEIRYKDIKEHLETILKGLLRVSERIDKLDEK